MSSEVKTLDHESIANRIAIEEKLAFEMTLDEWKKYKDKHPGARIENHTIIGPKEESKPKEEAIEQVVQQKLEKKREVEKKDGGEVEKQIHAISKMMADHPKPKGFRYRSPYEFVAKEGRSFKPSPLPEGIEKGPMKECFRNAFMLMVDREDLTYVEGYAMTKDLPLAFEHAWCVDKDGNVVDPTWDDGQEYFGIPFKREFAIKTVLGRGMSGVIDNPEKHFPLLREDADPDEYLKKMTD